MVAERKSGNTATEKWMGFSPVWNMMKKLG
jgi:hypothetical protein